MRLLLVHPGASWSTADVFDGLLYGLRAHGADVTTYRLDQRIEASDKSLHALWRKKQNEVVRARIAKTLAAVPESRFHQMSPKMVMSELLEHYPATHQMLMRDFPDVPKPNRADIIYHAGVGALEMALRQQVDVVLVVSAMFLHPDVILMMKRAGLRVTVLFTESPYDHAEELAIAKMVDGCWTNERACLSDFRAVNPRAGYLAHAWHPLKHTVGAKPGDEQVAAHDVVFVGSGFPERIAWFNAIDWTGIDLGLYGTWKGLGLNRRVLACVRGEQVTNEMASALYRRAKIGLNLYRTRGSKRLPLTHANGVTLVPESLSPRALELAACGVFHLSEPRAEVREVFGDAVPTFRSPSEAAALIRLWLKDDAHRQAVAAQLPACVAEASWVERAKTVLGDLQQLLAQRAAA